MKRCAKCGRAYSDLVTTCSYCGCALSGNTGTRPAPQAPTQPSYTPPTRPTPPPVQPSYTPPTRPTPPPAQQAHTPTVPPVQPSHAPIQPTASSENVGMGVLGAVLFGLGGAAVQAVILNMGKVAAIAGILCFFLTKLGYKKFSGIGERASKTAAWVCAPISLGMLFLGTVAGYAIYVANSLGVGIGEALSMVFSVSELTEAMGSDMGFSVMMWGASVVLSLILGRKKK